MTRAAAGGHGTRSSYVGGCRCEACTKANAAYVTNWRHETGRTDPAKDGRLLPPSPHGSAGRYGRHRCRCGVCRAANTARCRARRQARAQTQQATTPAVATAPSPHGSAAVVEGGAIGAAGPSPHATERHGDVASTAARAPQGAPTRRSTHTNKATTRPSAKKSGPSHYRKEP